MVQHTQRSERGDDDVQQHWSGEDDGEEALDAHETEIITVTLDS